jgi:uncharacterized protein (TIGR00369 family)
MRPESYGDGRCSFSLTVGPDHTNPYGAVHGGVVAALVDQAMGGAVHSRLEPGERCTTIEIKINYLAPVTAGELKADASLIQRTHRIGVLEARVHGDGGTLVAQPDGGPRRAPQAPRARRRPGVAGAPLVSAIRLRTRSHSVFKPGGLGGPAAGAPMFPQKFVRHQTSR